jgi:type VI secretion system secreted protein VgrG
MELGVDSSRFACDSLRVVKITGTTAISRLFRYDVEVVCLDAAAPKPADMLGEPITILLTPPSPDEAQRVHGIVAEIDDHLSDGAGRRVLRLRVVPRAARLALGASQEVYLNRSVPDLVKTKLESVGLTVGGEAGDVLFDFRATYAPREIVVQYKETDLAFVCRLAEHLGISFYFDHRGDAERMVFTDFAGGFGVGRAAHELAFVGRGEERSVYRLAIEHRLVPKSYTIHDYNYRLPQVAPMGTHELAAEVGYAGDVIEEHAHAKSPDEAQFLATVRAEERQAGQLVYVGKSTLPVLQAGVRFRLTDHPEHESIDLTVVEVEHEATQTSAENTGREIIAVHRGATYSNTFRAIPSDRTYRPARVTPRPRIHGVVGAVVDASLGGNDVFAPIDDQGRYRVRFFFDLTTPLGQVASSALRMIQNHSGARYGTHFPLKPGAEVLIAFVDGDPDRPIIVGAAPNPLTPSPVTSTNADLHVVRTHSGTRIECK